MKKTRDDIADAAAYHWATAHDRGRIRPHFLDFDSFPAPFKSYDYLNKILLSHGPLTIRADIHDLFMWKPNNRPSRPVNWKHLSQLLYLACGAIRKHLTGRIPHFDRTIPSAGGLYPCHVYRVMNNVAGIETGLYYGNMIQEFIGLIQKTDKATEKPNMPEFSLVITGEFYKSAWEYRRRAFRYLLLDAGHLLENIGRSLSALGWYFSVCYDFSDEQLSALLALDKTAEVPLALVSMGLAPDNEESDGIMLFPVLTDGENARTLQPQSPPVHYHLLHIAHEMGRPVVQKKGATLNPLIPVEKENTRLKLDNAAPFSHGKKDFAGTVLSRRSKRNFIPCELEPSAFSVIRSAFEIDSRNTTNRNLINPKFKKRNLLDYG